MCGRAGCTLRADDIPRACHRSNGPTLTVNMDRYRPSYNVSPGSNLPVVCREDGSGGEGYAIHCMKWGLIPSFTKKTEKPDFYRMFNARSESIGEKASFRRLLPKNRCLVTVEGFYEWKKDGSKKQPYYIHFKDDRPLVFAALYDSWQNSEGEILYSFTIVTTSSSSALQWLHDRMPVILGDKEATDAWLDDTSSTKFNALLRPCEDINLAWYPVTPAMGKPSFDRPDCIKEIHLKTEDKNTISKFFSKREIKEEQEANPAERGTCEKSDKMDPPKDVKEEHENEGKLHSSSVPEITKGVKEHYNVEKLDDSSVAKTLGHDLKSGVSTSPSDGAIECKTKRNREELLPNSKLNTDENDKLHTSPARKKANLKSGGDKQPTLLSFFDKK